MQQARLSFDQLVMDLADGRRRFLVAGVDEAGRGPLAGNVVAAAVILDPDATIAGLADSKKLAESRRDSLYDEIVDKATAWSVAEASVGEIDQLNILHASMLAMSRAIAALNPAPGHCLIDGNRCPQSAVRCQPVVGGDALIKEIAAASVIAKVTRDRDMLSLHEQHPEYGFDRHKGYPTRQHMQAIQQWGVLDIHRRSFAPVRQFLHNADSQRSPQGLTC